jgi:hypothetical protein
MSNKNTIPLNRPKRIGEMAGLWVGGIFAPLFAAGSLLRRGRIFHPRGVHFKAYAEPVEGLDSPLSELAQGLAQDEALVRFSAGIYRSDRGTLPDVLGLAIRFNVDPKAPYMAQDSSQDLLLVTAKNLLMLPLAMVRTNQRDFLANVYYGMARFEVGDRSNVQLRMVPINQSGNSSEDRYDKLREAVANGDTVFQLEMAAQPDPRRWIPLVRVYLQSEVTVDDRATQFWPFRTGQGIRPQGFVQFLRPVPYLASQWARSVFRNDE